MTFQGERFHIDIDDDQDTSPQILKQAPPLNLLNFVQDVQERQPSAPTAPKPPAARNTTSGFPSHRKRVTQSRFKQSRNDDADATEPSRASTTETTTASVSASNGSYSTLLSNNNDDFMSAEKRQINEENRSRMANMSPEEIEEERRELMESLSPALVQRLLQRANIDDEQPQDFPGLGKDDAAPISQPTKPIKKVAFAKEPEFATEPLRSSDQKGAELVSETQAPGADDNELDEDSALMTEAADTLPQGTVHFPRPPQPPELDPSSPSFLTDLHEKYFPSLAAEPEKLEWMTPLPDQSAYSSTQAGLNANEIRFNFNGALIPPNEAALIPVSAGLHHHGDAPDAAGYTIPELAMLARSTVPSQRCIAFRTLGRILFKLGKGEFGDPGDGTQGTVGSEDTLAALARGLWTQIEKDGVLELCIAESEGKGIAGGRHQSAIAYATEAVWLWQRGGGRRMKAQ